VEKTIIIIIIIFIAATLNLCASWLTDVLDEIPDAAILPVFRC
jgi:hypothetical protein